MTAHVTSGERCRWVSWSDVLIRCSTACWMPHCIADMSVTRVTIALSGQHPCVFMADGAYSLVSDVQVQRMRVDVETSSQLAAGQTVCDVWGHSGLPANVDVARRVLRPLFLSHILCPVPAHGPLLSYLGCVESARRHGRPCWLEQRWVGGMKAEWTCSQMSASAIRMF